MLHEVIQNWYLSFCWLLSVKPHQTKLMKKIVTLIVVVFAFYLQVKAQWLYPTDKFYTDGLHRSNFLTQVQSVGINITPDIEQIATAIGVCDTISALQTYSCYGVALALNRLQVVGTAGNITVKLMKTDGAPICNNDSSSYTIFCGRRLKNAPSTLIYQETYSLGSINLLPDPNGGNFSWANFNFSGLPKTFNTQNDDVMVVIDFSNMGNDTLVMMAAIDEYGTGAVKYTTASCWNKANYIYSYGILPLLKNDPYLVYSKKVTSCLGGNPNTFSNHFKWQINPDTFFVCMGDTVLLKPNARFGFGKAYDFEVKQNNTNLAYDALVNSYPQTNCGATGPQADYGFLYVADSNAYIPFLWPDSSYVNGNLIAANIHTQPYNQISLLNQIKVCPGLNQLNAVVNGPDYTALWRGAIFSDSTQINTTFNATVDTTLTLTVKTQKAGCETNKNVNIKVKQPYVQQLCGVTYDSLTHRKIILQWQKEQGAEVKSYHVYRSYDSLNLYQKIATINDSNATRFLDSNNTFLSNYAYKYKITTTDYCNNESVLDSSKSYNSMLVRNNYDTLYWNNYEINGVAVADSVIVWRSAPGSAFEKIATLSATQNRFVDSLLLNFLIVYYHIEAKLKDGAYCSDNSQRSVISSRLVVSEVGLYEKNLESFSVYPNPTNRKLNIIGTNKITQLALIYNVLGELVFESAIEPTVNNELDLVNLQTGIYFIKLGDAKPFKIVLNK
jgi:hypothetical protein